MIQADEPSSDPDSEGTFFGARLILAQKDLFKSSLKETEELQLIRSTASKI